MPFALAPAHPVAPSTLNPWYEDIYLIRVDSLTKLAVLTRPDGATLTLAPDLPAGQVRNLTRAFLGAWSPRPPSAPRGRKRDEEEDDDDEAPKKKKGKNKKKSRVGLLKPRYDIIPVLTLQVGQGQVQRQGQGGWRRRRRCCHHHLRHGGRQL